MLGAHWRLLTTGLRTPVNKWCNRNSRSLGGWLNILKRTGFLLWNRVDDPFCVS
jgi:hypothetical protein